MATTPWQHATLARNVSVPGAHSGTWGTSSEPIGQAADGNDNTYANFAFTSSGYSAILMLTGYGFSIPAGATVTGVELRLRRVGQTGDPLDYSIRLVEHSLPVGDDLATATAWPSSAGNAFYGGSNDSWGLSLKGADVNHSEFGVAIQVQATTKFSNARVYEGWLRIHYITNAPPEIIISPTVNYNGFTRTGPNNSPVTVSFTADDADGDSLTYQIRTAAFGGGTLVTSGAANRGSATNINVAHNAPGLAEGSNTLYLRVSDGTEWSDDAPFTLLVDRTPPSVGTITHSPNPVVN